MFIQLFVCTAFFFSLINIILIAIISEIHSDLFYLLFTHFFFFEYIFLCLSFSDNNNCYLFFPYYYMIRRCLYIIRKKALFNWVVYSFRVSIIIISRFNSFILVLFFIIDSFLCKLYVIYIFLYMYVYMGYSSQKHPNSGAHISPICL